MGRRPLGAASGLPVSPSRWQQTSVGLWRLLRPRQWLKNGFVLSAAMFSGKIFLAHDWAILAATLVGFCLLSSAVYVLNDLMDRKADALHPLKKNRPLASGLVTLPAASVLLVLSLVVSLVLLSRVGSTEILVGGSYFVLNVAYTFFLKRFFLIDVFSIALGFLLRAVAGGVAVHVALSPWFMLLLVLLATMLGLGKRRGELAVLGSEAARHKQALDNYTSKLIDQFMVILIATTITSYAIYGYFAAVGHHRLILTTPFVLYGLFRYLFILDHPHAAENPDELLVRDAGTLINLTLWVGASLIVLYVWK